jgi:hypothetical protein
MHAYLGACDKSGIGVKYIKTLFLDFGHFSVKTVTKATTMCPDKLTNGWGYADAAFARIDYKR